MNSSLITADGTTHLKILVLSLLASIFLVCVGLNARLSAADDLSAGPRLERNMSKPDTPRPAPEGPTSRAIV